MGFQKGNKLGKPIRFGRAKYGNVRTEVDGIKFASKKEATRYSELKLLEMAGKITGLECQKRFNLDVNGQKVCAYIADFVYINKAEGYRVIEDCKGFRTPEYKLKVKLMRAVHGIKIHET